MINPAALFKLKGAFSEFSQNHPKLLPFLKDAAANSLKEGTVVEISVTTPDGRSIKSNIRLSERDVQLFSEVYSGLK